MQNNIYVVSVIFILFIIIFVLFIQNRNLENFKSTIRNVEVTLQETPIKTYDNMYINACNNECANTKSCKAFTSTAGINNKILGNCKLYTSVNNITGLTPSETNNLYYM